MVKSNLNGTKLFFNSKSNNESLLIILKLSKWIVCFYHVTYEFESESTLYNCLNGWVFVYELSGCGFESHCCQNEITSLEDQNKIKSYNKKIMNFSWIKIIYQRWYGKFFW